VKRLLGFQSWLLGGALVALATQPVHAAATTITGVRVVPTGSGVRITLNTEGNDAPQVFAINQGNSLRADIVRTRLRLSEGTQFYQQSPAPGIDSIALVPLDANSVRLTVNSSGSQVPAGIIAEADSGGIVIDVNTNSGASQASTPLPSQLETVPGEPEQIAQTPDQAEPVDSGPVQNTDQPDVLVPSPEVTIDGVPIQTAQPIQVVPPFLPRAVAPPVGDLAVSESQPRFGSIDLGTAERVPRLVLRNAPSREVLTLLARAAGLNVVFVDPEGTGEGPPVTLDIQNESVQDTFNSVLRITGLDANRVGRTIYVGPDLPVSAQDISVRSLRLNQANVGEAVNFLVALGAESAISQEQLVTTVNAVPVGEGTPPITQTQTATVQQLQLQRIAFEDVEPILRGLQVVGETRTNSVTLVGPPHLIDLASEQLVRLDLRRRQVAINVRVIDIDLNSTDTFGTSFAFAIGGTDFITTPDTGLTVSSGAVGGNIGQLSLAINAEIANGNAKILTDPTLIVQEGQIATVALTEDVVTEIQEDLEVLANGNAITTRTFTIEPAGLLLQIDVDRIDDNGFVSLSVAPSITAPVDTFAINPGDANSPLFTLLSERQLSSGLVRVRDGQTLLLSGIIRESERTTTSKVPILGDLPILGALFRNQTDINERSEVIILVTPQILDDSDQSVWGYSYTPSEEIQEIINRSDNPQ
jgi:type IV pilus assembly protein PilQ